MKNQQGSIVAQQEWIEQHSLKDDINDMLQLVVKR